MIRQEASQLGPEVWDFAPDEPPAGYVRLAVTDPRTRWEPILWAGELCHHMRERVTGRVVVDVLCEHVRSALGAGYAF
jgi:hypothetical protein